MPAAGTSLCSECKKYKPAEEKCKRSNKCIECCKGFCIGKCGICHLAIGKCNSDERPDNCSYCGYHMACCRPKEDCCICGLRYCREERQGFVCEGKTYCIYCHSLNVPNCKHCDNCGLKAEHQECCGRCESCCDASLCSKRTKYKEVSMKMLDARYCSSCMRKSYGLCDYCGGKTNEVSGQKVPAPVLSMAPHGFRTNKSRRMAGLEIEVSSYTGGKACTAAAEKWGCQLTYDGSVPEGFECCTPPSNGDRLIEMLTYISNTMRLAKCLANDRAGLHCHVDAHDMMYSDMRKLIMIYARVETAIYGIIDGRRANTKYAMPYGEGLERMVSDVNPKQVRRDIMSLVFGDKADKKMRGNFDKGSHGAQRYYGLNLSSWWIRGTIEFRMHHGTTKAWKMIPWALLLISLVDTAVRVTDKEADNWPRGPAGLLKLCPSEEVKWYVALRWQYFQAKRQEILENKRLSKAGAEKAWR